LRSLAQTWIGRREDSQHHVPGRPYVGVFAAMDYCMPSSRAGFKPLVGVSGPPRAGDIGLRA